MFSIVRLAKKKKLRLVYLLNAVFVEREEEFQPFQANLVADRKFGSILGGQVDRATHGETLLQATPIVRSETPAQSGSASAPDTSVQVLPKCVETLDLAGAVFAQSLQSGGRTLDATIQHIPKTVEDDKLLLV